MAYDNYVNDTIIGNTTYGFRDKDHREDNTKHVTSQERSAWNNKIASEDYATQTKGGTIKAWLEGTTLYIQTVDE